MDTCQGCRRNEQSVCSWSTPVQFSLAEFCLWALIITFNVSISIFQFLEFGKMSTTATVTVKRECTGESKREAKQAFKL